MTKNVTNGQAGLILALFSVALKLSVLPAMFNDYASNNSYVACLFALIIDFVLCLIVITIIIKIPNKTFFELISDVFSKPIAIILNAILMGYFIIKSLIALLELHDYYIASLFEELNPLFFIISFLFLLLWLFGKSFRNLGRSLQIFFWPMAIGLLFTLIFPISDIQLTNLLPLFQNGMYQIFNSIFHTAFAFDDYIILLLLMGRIKVDKNTRKTLLTYLLSIFFFVFSFYVVFVGSFGNTAVNQSLALNELPLHNPFSTALGRLEWLTIIIWTAILLLQSAVLGKCSCSCFDSIFNSYDKKVSPPVIVGILGIGIFFTYLKLYDVIKFVTSTPFNIALISFHGVLITILIISAITTHNKTNHKGAYNEKHVEKVVSQ